MSKDQTPKADGLRAMREETRGHLQATAEPSVRKPRDALAPPKKKLIPFAGAERSGGGHGGGIPFSKNPKVKK